MIRSFPLRRKNIYTHRFEIKFLSTIYQSKMDIKDKIVRLKTTAILLPQSLKNH